MARPIASEKSQPRWFAVYTQPRAEKKVSDELAKHGIEHYLPLQRTLRFWSDRKKWVDMPLFNSYVFVRIDYGRSFQAVLNVRGIVKFVRFGNDVATLRDSQIESIKLLLSNFEGIEVTSEHYEPGVPVEVIAGPLKGHRGKVIERKGSRYFSIDIEQIGAQLLVSLPPHFLKPA